MAKKGPKFICTACGAHAPKWMGKCSKCKAWNTLEEPSAVEVRATKLPPPGKAVALCDVRADRGGEVRLRTGIGELDRVLGGGLVAGGLVLLGGDPGVGKSTILLSALHQISRRGLTTLYVSGEESVRQIKLRADRLGLGGECLFVLAETDFSKIEATIRDQCPAVVVIDSVQTVAVPELTQIPGSVAQVREVAHRCMLLAKGHGTATIVVGHITKSGQLAGPKVLEHLVDTVLYFEGDGRTPLRILRANKNRFGAAGELGMFEMGELGLEEVPDPSARLLQERIEAPGTAVIAAMEGSRPVLTEVQALVGRASPQIPARTCVGVDRTRVLMLAAVLEKSGISVHDRDIFVNAAGGIRLMEPAADLGIVAAIASSLCERPLPSDLLFFGEVGLVGEVRNVAWPAARLKEALRYGFRRVIGPARLAADCPKGIELIGVRTVTEALEFLGLL